MNLFDLVKADLIEIIKRGNQQTETLPMPSIVVELPREKEHGDMVTNAAMVLAKFYQKTPIEFAKHILPDIGQLEYVQNVEIAGPGFINLRFKPEFWQQIILKVLDEQLEYGNSSIGNNEQINLEYVLVNKVGPMHIGHARGAVIGDVLANLLKKAGYNVTKEFAANTMMDLIRQDLDLIGVKYDILTGEPACIQNKLDRGFKKLILIVGADHSCYVARVKALVSSLSNNQVTLDVKLIQMVNWVEKGAILKMSKRAGNYISTKDVVEMVGKDAIRFMMLTRKNEMTLDFDVNKVREQSKDNPAFYVQYAHARAKYILRNALEEAPESSKILADNCKLPIHLLQLRDELELIKLLAFWPKLVETAAQTMEVHPIVCFLQDLAAQFHGFWNKGNENKKLRFIIKDNKDLTAARLALTKAMALVLASGLALVGITAAEEM